MDCGQGCRKGVVEGVLNPWSAGSYRPTDAQDYATASEYRTHRFYGNR